MDFQENPGASFDVVYIITIYFGPVSNKLEVKSEAMCFRTNTVLKQRHVLPLQFLSFSWHQFHLAQLSPPAAGGIMHRRVSAHLQECREEKERRAPKYSSMSSSLEDEATRPSFYPAWCLNSARTSTRSRRGSLILTEFSWKRFVVFMGEVSISSMLNKMMMN